LPIPNQFIFFASTTGANKIRVEILPEKQFLLSNTKLVFPQKHHMLWLRYPFSKLHTCNRNFSCPARLLLKTAELKAKSVSAHIAKHSCSQTKKWKTTCFHILWTKTTAED